MTGTGTTAATVPVNTSYSDTATDSHVITSFLTTFPHSNSTNQSTVFPQSTNDSVGVCTREYPLILSELSHFLSAITCCYPSLAGETDNLTHDDIQLKKIFCDITILLRVEVKEATNEILTLTRSSDRYSAKLIYDVVLSFHFNKILLSYNSRQHLTRK